MSDDDLILQIGQLEAANAAYRKIHDDQRDHLAALREEVLQLRQEVSRLMADRESLQAENALLRKQRGSDREIGEEGSRAQP
jgi:hypothetical protein